MSPIPKDHPAGLVFDSLEAFFELGDILEYPLCLCLGLLALACWLLTRGPRNEVVR